MRVGHIAQKAARLLSCLNKSCFGGPRELIASCSPLSLSTMLKPGAAHSVRANRIGRLLCRHWTRCVDAGSAMRVRFPPECFKNGILQGACSDLNY